MSAKSGSIQEKSGCGARTPTHSSITPHSATSPVALATAKSGSLQRASAAPRRSAPAQQDAAAQQDLVAGEQEAGQEQRDDVVVEPEHHDRADDVRRAHVGLQAEQHRGVEHADAAGQVGGEAGGVGRDVDAQEDRPGQMRRGRQQRVEDRRGDRDIHRRQHHLQDRHPPAGQVDLVAEQPHAAEHARQRDVADDDRPQQRADRIHHRDRHVLAEERDRLRLEEQDRAAQHHAAECEGQAAERHGLGDLQRRQPPMRVQPVAHRRAGHRGEAQIVRQRVGAERGERDAAVATPCVPRRSCRAGRRWSARA